MMVDRSFTPRAVAPGRAEGEAGLLEVLRGEAEDFLMGADSYNKCNFSP